MLTMIGAQILFYIMKLGIDVVFYAVVAYWAAKMARKGWNAGK